jgi:hypothetical protein
VQSLQRLQACDVGPSHKTHGFWQAIQQQNSPTHIFQCLKDAAEPAPPVLLSVFLQVAVPQRLQAFAAVLAASLGGSGGHPLPAHSPLPRLAVTFVTANLKVGCCWLVLFVIRTCRTAAAVLVGRRNRMVQSCGGCHTAGYPDSVVCSWLSALGRHIVLLLRICQRLLVAEVLQLDNW